MPWRRVLFQLAVAFGGDFAAAWVLPHLFGVTTIAAAFGALVGWITVDAIWSALQGDD